MSKKINQSIKAITEGGIFTAGYALLAIISRYLITGTDSLIYYFTPLLMAIYIARNKISYSIAVLAASITLSFLFANPLIALIVIIALGAKDYMRFIWVEFFKSLIVVAIVTIITFVCMKKDYSLNKKHGIVFVIMYAVYMAYTIIR